MRKFRHGVTSLRRHVGVAGLQEIGSNRRRHYLASIRGWGYYRPRYIQQNPVIWNRSRFRLVRAHGDRIARSRHLRGQLPGATRRKKDSTATVVRLRHLASGRRISVINVHLVHGAVKGGKPWPHRPAVFNLFRNQVAGLVQAVKRERRWGRVFVTGDFNVGYRADQHFALPRLPYRRLSRQRLDAVWQGTGYLRRGEGTHSDALIDQIWSGSGPSNVRILRWVRPSDHFPVVATYRIPRR
jgi:endonuclease/exonuclease/phosphatase (EEP) superfamily protein YafD